MNWKVFDPPPPSVLMDLKNVGMNTVKRRLTWIQIRLAFWTISKLFTEHFLLAQNACKELNINIFEFYSFYLRSFFYLKDFWLNAGFYIGNAGTGGKLHKVSFFCLFSSFLEKKQFSFIISSSYVKVISSLLFTPALLTFCFLLCFFFFSLNIAFLWTVCSVQYLYFKELQSK